jgi:hypothetical protein
MHFVLPIKKAATTKFLSYKIVAFDFFIKAVKMNLIRRRVVTQPLSLSAPK